MQRQIHVRVTRCLHAYDACIHTKADSYVHTYIHTVRTELSKMKRAVRASSATPRKKDWRETSIGTPRSETDAEDCKRCAAYAVSITVCMHICAYLSACTCIYAYL